MTIFLICFISYSFGIISGILIYRKNVKYLNSALLDAKNMALEIATEAERAKDNLKEEIKKLKEELNTLSKTKKKKINPLHGG